MRFSIKNKKIRNFAPVEIFRGGVGAAKKAVRPFAKFMAFVALASCLYSSSVMGASGNDSSLVVPSKYSAIIYDGSAKEVLHECNADKQLYPASMTKLMTLYMLFEALEKGDIKPDADLQVSALAEKQVPSKLGLKEGESIKVEDAIKALIVKSANDVAMVVAENLSDGNAVKFADNMTSKAKKLGMKRTVFKNPSGLPNMEQLSTARDILSLSTALYNDFPQYAHYFAEKTFTYNGTTYRSHNRMIFSYKGMTGLKTGYIRAAGFNLAASAKRGDKEIFAVVFGGKSAARRNIQMKKMLDLGFERANMPKKKRKFTAKAKGKCYNLPRL